MKPSAHHKTEAVTGRFQKRRQTQHNGYSETDVVSVLCAQLQNEDIAAHLKKKRYKSHLSAYRAQIEHSLTALTRSLEIKKEKSVLTTSGLVRKSKSGST